MKKLKILTVLLMTAFLVCGAGDCAFADSTRLNGEAHFDGSKIKSTFDAQKVTDTFENLQPGDEITVTVKYQNDYSASTDWYMANEIVKTLEKIDNAKKAAGEDGKAENGGYTYSLIQTDKDGKQIVLFSNDKVGGDAKPAGMEGLEQATNALDDWFYIETLKKGQFGLMTLNVRFDGETEVNDYMDTDGEVLLKFAVELTKSGKQTGTPTYLQKFVNTGDMHKIGYFLLMIISGLLILTVLLMRKNDKKRGAA